MFAKKGLGEKEKSFSKNMDGRTDVEVCLW